MINIITSVNGNGKYSTKYYLKNETKFYLSEKDENSEKYNVKHVSQDKLYEIYNNLGDSYDILDRVRGKNIAKHLYVHTY